MADTSIHLVDSPYVDDEATTASVAPSKTVAIVGLSLVVVVAAIAIGFRFIGSTSTGATAAVRGALVSTLASRTADLAISESIDVEGQMGTAKGVGRCDLRIDACSATLNYNGALSQLGTESMVYAKMLAETVLVT